MWLWETSLGGVSWNFRISLFLLFCNCFIRWVLILSRVCADRCTGRQHSKKHSQTQLLLNETRDLTQTFHITQILPHRIVTRDYNIHPMLINLRYALWQSKRYLTVSCFQTKPQAKLFNSGPISLSVCWRRYPNLSRALLLIRYLVEGVP